MAVGRDDVFLSLGVDPARFDDGVRRAEAKVQGFAATTAQAAKRLEHLFEFDIILRGAEKVYEFLHSSAEAADKMGKLAQSVGLPVETMQRFGVAAKMADLSQEQLGGGMAKLARNMQKADADSGDAARAFEALGIKTTDAAGHLRATDDVFLDIADRFAGMEGGAGKTAIAMMLFGKSGADMIPVLNLGRTGIADFGDKAQRAGKILSDETVRGAEEFNDAIKRLGGGASALGATIAAELSEPLNALVDDLTNGANAAENMKAAAAGVAGGIRGIATAAIVGYAALRPLVEMGKAALALKEGRLGDAAAYTATAVMLGDPLAASRDALRSASELWGGDADQRAKEEGRYIGHHEEKKTRAPLIPQAEKQTKEVDAFAKVLATLRTETDALAAAMAKVEGSKMSEVVGKMNAGPLSDALRSLSPSARDFEIESYLNAAGAIDDLKAKRDADAEAEKRRLDMMREGAKITTDLLTPSEAYAATLQNLNGLLSGGAITWETYGRAAKKAQSDMDAALLSKNALATDLTRGIQGIFEDTFSGGGRIDELFANMLKRLAAKAAAQEIMLQLGFKIPGVRNEGVTGFGALKDLWSALGFGGISGAKVAGLSEWDAVNEFGGLDNIVPYMASGGSVGAGSPYIVGEAGPELFVPSISGTVVPNNQLGAAGGDTYHFNFPNALLVDRRAMEDLGRQYGRDLAKGMRG